MYCRLRPLRDEEDESCAEVVSETALQLTPPGCSLAFKNHGHKNPVSRYEVLLCSFFFHRARLQLLTIASFFVFQTRHVFKHIFDSEATQKHIFDDIAFPLVEDLVLGKNGAYVETSRASVCLKPIPARGML